MRVVFLAAGNSIHTIRWVNSMSQRGHEVHLIFLPDQKPVTDRIDPKVNTYALKYSGIKGYYLNVLEIRKLIKKINPDVINSHYASGYGTLTRVARLKKTILSVWGSDVYEFPYKNILFKQIVKKNLIYADLIASTSHAMAEQVKNLVSKNELDISVTPFGVDLSQFQSKDYEIENEVIKIGLIKTLAPKYGIKDLIHAIHLIKNQGIIVELDIYGDGPQKDELNKLIKSLDLDSEVSLKGKIPNTEVPEKLLTFDIFSVTSIEESFGVAVVEAMAASLPVVATNAEGFVEVVEDEITGLICEKENPYDISEKLIKLIQDPLMRRQMGKAGRLRAEKLYDWNNNLEKMESLYARVN